MNIRHIILITLIAVVTTSCSTAKTTERFRYSTDSLHIHKLDDITRSDYVHYKDFVNDGTAYIIVHPAYYTFYGNDDKNEQHPLVTNFMAHQVTAETNFIKRMGKERNLTILIIPGKWLDENYIRFINGITVHGSSVLFIESKNANTGSIDKRDLRKMKDFLKGLGVSNIIVGGGYIGRCQDSIYRKLARAFGDDTVAVAPEISIFSPDDISEATIQMLMTADNQINFNVITSLIQAQGANKKTNIRNISVH